MKRFSSLLFISLFLFASSTWAQTSTSDKQLAHSCLEKYKQNDLDGAIADCSKAIELNPRSTDAYAVRGLIFMQKGNLEGAIADLDKALVLDPRNPNLYRGRGIVKLKKGEIDGSIADYDKAVDIDPSFESYRQRAMANFAKGNFDKAIKPVA
jgi:tetratricopeptide (TPR) repeat protein